MKKLNWQKCGAYEGKCPCTCIWDRDADIPILYVDREFLMKPDDQLKVKDLVESSAKAYNLCQDILSGKYDNKQEKLKKKIKSIL